MGHIRNHAIIVTAEYGDHIHRAHTKARQIFGNYVSEVTPSGTNGSQSFFVPPDGSKEGWEESHAGDRRREEFKTWLRAQAYDDYSTPFSWVELWYGGDDMDAQIEDDGYTDYRRARAREKNMAAK